MAAARQHTERQCGGIRAKRSCAARASGASNATASAGIATKGRGRGRDGRGRGRGIARTPGAARATEGTRRGRGAGGIAAHRSAAEATLVEMGYAPAAARRALEATGSVEAAISALDPGYCAAVDTQHAPRQREPPPALHDGTAPRRNHRRGGARPRSRGARTGPGASPSRRLHAALRSRAGVASPFACGRADEAPPEQTRHSGGRRRRRDPLPHLPRGRS